MLPSVKQCIAKTFKIRYLQIHTLSPSTSNNWKIWQRRLSKNHQSELWCMLSSCRKLSGAQIPVRTVLSFKNTFKQLIVTIIIKYCTKSVFVLVLLQHGQNSSTFYINWFCNDSVTCLNYCSSFFRIILCSNLCLYCQMRLPGHD